MSPLSHPGLRRFARFGLVGGCSAVMTLTLRIALTWLIPFEAAVAVAHVAGLTVAFNLNRLFVFTEFRGSLWRAYGRFFAVNLLSLAIATAVSSLLYRLVLPSPDPSGWWALVAHFIGLGAAAVPSYFSHATFSFRTPPAATLRSSVIKR